MCSEHMADRPPRKPAFFTAEQMADILGIQIQSLRMYRSHRPDRLPPHAKHGQRLAFAMDDLRAWATEHRPLDCAAIIARAEALR